MSRLAGPPITFGATVREMDLKLKLICKSGKPYPYFLTEGTNENSLVSCDGQILLALLLT